MRSQLLQSGLPLHLWGELAIYCSLQINCSPTIALQHHSPLQTLESLIPGHLHPFDEKRLKPFGCLCFATDRGSKSKMAPVAKRFIFVGLEPGARAARLWDKHTGKVFVTGDIIYREDVFPALDPKLSPDVLQDWIFPTLSDERVDSPIPERINREGSLPLPPTLPEGSSNSVIDEGSAVSPPFVPFCPKTLIPLSASIHAPRRDPNPPITDSRMRSQAESSDSESDSPPSPLRLPATTPYSHPLTSSSSASSQSSAESSSARSNSPPLDNIISPASPPPSTPPPLPSPAPVSAPPPPDPPQVRTSGRIRRIPDRYGFSATTGTDSDSPSYSKAMSGPDKEAWKQAMQREFDSLMQHGVGTLVDPPAGANVLGGMWIFNRKRDEHHRIVKYKARWVVLGNHQVKGLDYDDTYASVGKIDSLRILLALSTASSRDRRWKVRQFDIVTAFLNGDMKDQVYAKQPTGFEHPTQPKRVWLLIKSL